MNRNDTWEQKVEPVRKKDRMGELECRIRSADEYRAHMYKTDAPAWILMMVEDELIRLAEEHLALCQQRLDFYKSL